MPSTDPRIAAGMATQLAQRRALLDAGAKPVGFKLGLGGAAAMAQLGTTGALVGFFNDANVLADGAAVAIGGWDNPRLEPELAVRIGADGAIDAVAVAIELADLADLGDDVEAILAANVFQRHVLLGPPHPPAALPTRSVLTRDAEEVFTSDDPLSAPGDPGAAVAHLTAVLAAAGEPLRGGEWLITGTFVAPIAIAPGESFTHALEPLGSISVALTP